MIPLLLALALLPGAGGPPAARPSAVLVISVDGLHPDALSRAPMPRLLEVAAKGQVTLLGRSTVPPKTLIAHTAMVTGLAPEASGKTDNDWEPGEATVEARTLFHAAREAGYRTGYLYSKEKLGYLASAAVDVHALAPDDGIARARRLLAEPGKAFVFLHVSGLEFAGMRAGWLSPDYLAKARAIDGALAPLLDEVEARGSYLVVVTSDHACHGLEHGTGHPEDGRRPVLLRSDLPGLQGQGPPPAITGLMPLVGAAMGASAR
jgi:predicted AlkP superfamily pyrophosphatase or phosphodiesterase